jgi:hypothetical protein
MNERIKELSQQASDYADSLELGGAEWCEAWEAKFAELLIEEVRSICCEGMGFSETNYVYKRLGQELGVK